MSTWLRSVMGRGISCPSTRGCWCPKRWASEDEHRGALADPGEVGTVVPGWREAMVLHDPRGVAAQLKREALDWSWQRLGDEACDRWVAKRIVSFSEEAQKLSAALARSAALTAAVQRDLLALHLAPAIAVHRRLLYGSENRLWAEVGDAMGAQWTQAQAAAFSTGGEGFAASCAAALQLFRLAAESADELLDDRQRAVVQHALETHGRGRR